MSSNRIASFHLALFFWLSMLIFAGAAPAAAQIAQLPERPEEHRHSHDINLPSGVTDKCEPAYTYEEGPRSQSLGGCLQQRAHANAR